MPMQLLITGAWGDAHHHLATLEELGYQIHFLQQETEPLPCDPSMIESVVCNGLFLHHDIRQFSNLRLIQLTSAGYDRVPVDYIREQGIELHNAGDVYSIPMAEFVMSSVLQVYKQSRFFAENQRGKRWEKHRGLRELAGKTVCMIGCGNVGTACARLFSAFGCCVVGVAATARQQEHFCSVVAREDLLPVVSDADITVAALPLAADTRGLLGREFFSAMKEESIFVNVARGAVVDTEAMINALQTKDITAILDVFEEEPLDESSPLWDMDGVILTPHNSFVGDGAAMRLSSLILARLNLWAEGMR